MDRTPKSKFFTPKFKESEKHDAYGYKHDNIKTPTQKSSTLNDDDNSPMYVPCTQEAFDQLDVVWDWNSPTSKQKQKVTAPKRSYRHHSPKLPIKRHPSNNEMQSYDKLKSKLEALKNQLTHENLEYEKNTTKGKALFSDKMDDEDDIKALETLFEDDSIEEEMVLQSQRIEELFTMKIKNNACDIPCNSIKHSTQNTPVKLDPRRVKSDNNISSSCVEITNKRTNSITNIDKSQVYKEKCSSINKFSANIHEDSFDIDFESFEDEKLGTSKSANHKQISNKNAEIKYYQEHSSPQKIYNHDEIEQKRLQALAKLKSKKQGTTHNISRNNSFSKEEMSVQQIPKEETSPIRCSPDQIEQKRLQALAKLEAKKKQDIIEKNRREALKRLEISKKRRAMASQHLSLRK